MTHVTPTFTNHEKWGNFEINHFEHRKLRLQD